MTLALCSDPCRVGSFRSLVYLGRGGRIETQSHGRAAARSAPWSGLSRPARDLCPLTRRAARDDLFSSTMMVRAGRHRSSRARSTMIVVLTADLEPARADWFSALERGDCLVLVHRCGGGGLQARRRTGRGERGAGAAWGGMWFGRALLRRTMRIRCGGPLPDERRRQTSQAERARATEGTRPVRLSGRASVQRNSSRRPS